tara:strand:+ start:979 stop:1098 length:120 start_codon:yes stop_codon:yes gene_type:complete
MKAKIRIPTISVEDTKYLIAQFICFDVFWSDVDVISLMA